MNAAGAQRRDGWLDRLWATLEAARDRPFEYGDCVKLAAECVDTVRGSTFTADVAPLLDAAREKPVTLEELQAFVTQRLGEPIALLQTCQGDVVLLDLPWNGVAGGPTLGICVGHQIACAGIKGGVVYLKLDKGKTAWRV